MTENHLLLKLEKYFERIELIWKKYELGEFPKSSGLYQIYGTSPIYGIDTLLYIGKADNLKTRLGAHERNKESFITRQPNKTIRYCELSKDLIQIVEEILIVMQKPSFNSSNLIKISQTACKKYYYIQNHGDRGILNLEVSNYYFVNPDKLSQALLDEDE